MKILQINIFGNLSTGRIMVDLAKTISDAGYEAICAFARNEIEDDVDHIRIGSKFNVYADGIKTRLTDRAGFFSKRATVKLIDRIKKENPDIVHLHNLHGYYINIEVLFNFLQDYGKPVVWTLHDCWAYTGHCCYYSDAKCDKWVTGCNNCHQIKTYPASFVDQSARNYRDKKRLFTGISNLTLVTVSKWLESEVKKSFLNNTNITTIYNGVDLDIFKPTKGEIIQKYGLPNKRIVLGVASTWSERKGLLDFLKLAEKLSDDFIIVLLGISEKQKKNLPTGICALSRTNSLQELVELYSAADVYFNASVEETFGLPTVEALACGTPVIVYNKTAVPEVVSEECGYVVKAHDLDKVTDIIESGIYRQIDSEICRKQANKYEKKLQYKSYIDLYEKILKER